MPAKHKKKQPISKKKNTTNPGCETKEALIEKNYEKITPYLQFISNYEEYKAAHSNYKTQIDSPSAIIRLSKAIVLLEENLEILDRPASLEDFGPTHIRVQSGELLVNISLFHSLVRKDFGTARSYLKRSIHKGSLAALLEMAELEWFALLVKYKQSEIVYTCSSNEKRKLIQASVCVLDEALKPENSYFLNSKIKMLSQISYRLLQGYISTNAPDETIKDFFSKYQNFLGALEFYGMMALAQQKNQLDQILYWKIQLLCYLKSNKDSLPNFENEMRELTPRLARSYWEMDQYQEFSIHLITHRSYFSAEDLSLYAASALELSLKQPKLFTQRFLLLAKAWIITNATDKENTTCAITYINCFYLFHLAKIKFFEAEPILSFLKKHINSKEQQLSSLVHLLYGNFYLSGYDSIRIDNTLTLKHFKIAAALGHVSALEYLALIYSDGLIVPCNTSKAIRYCYEALEKANANAGILLTEILLKKINKLRVQLAPNLVAEGSKFITQALDALHKAEEILKQHPYADSDVNSILAKIYVKRANCYFELDSFLNFREPNYFKSRIGSQNFNIINSLETALEYNSNCASALQQLGIFTMLGLFVAQDFHKACHYLEHLNTIKNSDFFGISIFLSLIYDKLRLNTTSIKEKRLLHQKALTNYQICLKQAEKNPAILTAYRTLYALVDGNYSTEDTTVFISSLLKHKNVNADKKHSLNAIDQLLKKSKTQPSSQNLLELTQHIINLGNDHLDAASYFSQLTELVKTFVDNFNDVQEDISSLIHVFSAVSQWHLLEANQALEPLFIHFIRLVGIKQNPLSMSEWSRIIKILASCSFSAEIQEKNINGLLKSAYLKKLVTESSCSITDLARFFYALSLLDTKTSSNEIYAPLAFATFNQLMNLEIHSASASDISEIYHASKHFSQKYPDFNWQLSVEAMESFEKYAESLKNNKDPVSNTQKRIFELLKTIQPNKEIQMEAFIPEVGRRVDFLCNNLVIQYHGTWQHYLYDNKGNIAAKSIKDELCEQDLIRAGYKVVIISREEWGAVYDNEKLQIALLKKKLPNFTAAVKKSFVPEEKYADVFFKEPKETVGNNKKHNIPSPNGSGYNP